MTTVILAGDVIELRHLTGFPMMQCKEALVEAGGDMTKAQSILREKGATTTKAAATGEGVIAIFADPTSIGYGIAEISTQTDFAARTPEVRKFALDTARETLYDGSLGDEEEGRLLTNKTGESISIRRAEAYMASDNTNGSVGAYVHHDGKTAAAVMFCSNSPADVPSEEVRKMIAMHLAAVTPTPLSIDDSGIPEALVEAERVFLTEKAAKTGKPPEILAKIVDGGLSKFKKERSLLDQPLVSDPKKKVRDLLPAGTVIVNFDRWQVGEVQ